MVIKNYFCFSSLFLTLLLYFYSSNKSDLFSMYQTIKNQKPLLPSLISSSLRLTSKFQFFSKPLIGFLRPVLTRPLSGSPRRLRASFCIPGSALRCAPVSLQSYTRTSSYCRGQVRNRNSLETRKFGSPALENSLYS